MKVREASHHAACALTFVLTKECVKAISRTSAQLADLLVTATLSRISEAHVRETIWGNGWILHANWLNGMASRYGWAEWFTLIGKRIPRLQTVAKEFGAQQISSDEICCRAKQARRSQRELGDIHDPNEGFAGSVNKTRLGGVEQYKANAAVQKVHLGRCFVVRGRLPCRKRKARSRPIGAEQAAR